MRTTININRCLSEKLINTAKDLNISYHNLIVLLMDFTVSKNVLYVKSFQSIQYQDCDPEKNWLQLHVKFNMSVYEKGLDLKKMFKMSLSFFISFAIFHVLDELVEKFIKSKNKTKLLDNYNHNYLFIVKKFNNIFGIMQIWGIPDKRNLKTYFSY